MDPLSITGKLLFTVTLGPDAISLVINIIFSERHCRSSTHCNNNLSLLRLPKSGQECAQKLIKDHRPVDQPARCARESRQTCRERICKWISPIVDVEAAR